MKYKVAQIPSVGMMVIEDENGILLSTAEVAGLLNSLEQRLAAAEIELQESEERGGAMAATQCIHDRNGKGIYGDDHGHTRCAMEQRLAEAEKKISEWEAAPEWVKAGDGTLHGAIDYWQDRAHKAEQRLRWILKKCFVNRYAEVSLPCGMTLITDDEIQESIILIDRAIELKEKGEL